MRSKRTEYEVRCPRCEVTFPLETKVCIHCGGPTGAAGKAFGILPVFDFDSHPGDGGDPGESGDAATWQAEGMSSADSGALSRPHAIPLEDEEMDSEARGVGRSILGSMGSLIWIALLIAFSLSGRVCGE